MCNVSGAHVGQKSPKLALSVASLQHSNTSGIEGEATRSGHSEFCRSRPEAAGIIVYDCLAVGRDLQGARDIQRRRYSAACRDGGRTLARPSASVAEIVVRTMSRASCAGQGRPRCRVARLSHMTTSPLRQVCT